MYKRIITSLVIALLLVMTLTLPAVATEYVKTASVTVSQDISVTLVDPGAGGIDFGQVMPSASAIYGDVAQGSGTPAISVQITTNDPVDISIMGSTAGALTIDKWKYSSDFAQTDITSLTGSFVLEYDEAVTGNYDFYHWISIPLGTTATSYSATITYKVE